jgi:hypothetical protein
MADRFGLDKIRDGVRERADELSEDARVRSYDDTGREDEGPFKPFTFQQEDFDRTEPDHDAMRKYWRQFETTPFVRKSITSFARQVMEPGYYIQARGLEEDQLTELDKWLTKAAIIEGETGQDFRQLAKKLIIQMEVRGTGFVEKAPSKDDSDDLAGLKLINAETMEAVTRPGQSILLQSDDIDEYDDAPEAESGGAAAWLQDLGETETFFATPISGRNRGVDNDKDDDFKIGFREDEIIKIARDADAGELFGTSRLEAVSDRIEGLRQKLCDNDDAIASKAYPLWLFLFGTEDNPWEADDINEFMRSHEMENFHSGMKQGVRGDVDVKTVSGEVADIADALNFDINWIMSVMPVPMYMLGAFQEGAQVGQFGGIAQQQEMQRQIKDTRREIEEKFTPVIREVAEQMGMNEDAVETLRLKVGSPGEPQPETPARENVIRYVPKDQRDPSPQQDGQSPGNDGLPSGVGDRDALPPDMQNEIQPDNPESSESPQDAPEEAGAQLWHSDQGLAELGVASDSRLSDAIYEAMVATRDETLQNVGSKFENAPMFAASSFEQEANSVLREQMSRGRFRDQVKPVVEELVEDDNSSSFTQSNSVKFFTQNVENATEDALEEMLRLMRIQVRRGANNGEELDNVLDRVKNKYNDAKLRERAELIAHMESKNIAETVALQQYERDPDVIGVRVSNDDPSTPLTQSLAGAEAYFDDGDIQSQLAGATRDEFLQKGFDPLPTTPPFHFNDTTTLEPIFED